MQLQVGFSAMQFLQRAQNTQRRQVLVNGIRD